MANHILEMAGLELICDHIFIKNIAKIRLPMICRKRIPRSKTTLKSLISLCYSGLFRISLYLFIKPPTENIFFYPT